MGKILARLGGFFGRVGAVLYELLAGAALLFLLLVAPVGIVAGAVFVIAYAVRLGLGL